MANKVPVLSGSNKLLRFVARILDQNDVVFYWTVTSPTHGIMEPAKKEQYERFSDIVTSLPRYYEGFEGMVINDS